MANDKNDITCVCASCGLVHKRSERIYKKYKRPKKVGKLNAIARYLCPRCNSTRYTVL